MIGLLQDCITSVEIEADCGAIYNHEFLYYWGMTCLGEQSTLVYKNIDIARNCFKKIKGIVPNAEARLAYIGLLGSDEPTKSEDNVKRIDTLRRWARKQDLFSRIVLARIVFDQFLKELEENDSEVSHGNISVQEEMGVELPLRAIQLLKLPCNLGHPVAVKFWNEAVEYIGSPSALKWKLDDACINAATLCDYKPIQTCK